MERKEFLRKGLSALGLATVTPIVVACAKDKVDATAETGTDTTNPNTSGACISTPAETVGPYPTKSPTSWVRKDIRADSTGILMTLNITIQNKTNGCAALSGALVDVWHCDKDGNYSEYGSATLQNVHFLRGRQTTDMSGLATFTTVFPGWYSGRAPHIHVHIYNASGKSLLVTQIAFPKDVCDVVYGTATNFYTKGLQDTTNERDNVFRDGFATEMAAIAGTVKDGYALTHTIVVSA
jgi:protocatechuate 3,4-dioxygenase beta subunit